jgi:hypothetical protein
MKNILVRFWVVCFAALSLGCTTLQTQKHADDNQISLLFMITADNIKLEKSGTYEAGYVGEHFVINSDAHVLVFSDRPHRVAKRLEGGLVAFTEFYGKSDFVTDPPNITFAGKYNVDGAEKYSVLEMSKPFFDNKRVIVPIVSALGDQVIPPHGDYSGISIVVDNIFGAVIGWVETGLAGVGTAIACGPGEIITAGADTALCVAGVIGTGTLAVSSSCETADAAGKPCP